MPAVELTRLRTQINGLILRFTDPTGLRYALRDLLEIYGNRAYRPGKTVQVQSLLPSYRVTPLVIRQLGMELGKTCQEQPDAALDVVEALWHDPYLEPRLLATTLLGAIPASHAGAVAAKIRDWARPEENSKMLDALFEQGASGLRAAAPQPLLNLAEDWMNSAHTEIQALGIRALVPLIREPSFENLPPIFRMLSPLVQNAAAPLHIDLQIALEALASRSQTETAYFLRQTLNMASGPGTARLIRRCLPLFEQEQQAALRVALLAASQG